MSNSESSLPTAKRSIPPQDAFALIGNEIRSEILRVLGENPHSMQTFSELHSAVDVECDSGQFNYHLQRLVGHFIGRCEEGYRLYPRGIILYRTIIAGTFTHRASFDPFDAGFDCHFCDSSVEASYDDGQFIVQCSGCGHDYNHTMTPPSLTDDGQSLLSRADQHSRHEFLAFARGVCPICAGDITVQFLPAGEGPFHTGDDLNVLTRLSCEHCGATQYLSIGAALLKDPGLISFCHEHGLDVTMTPIWELEFASTDRYVSVLSTDPWEVALELVFENECLELVVDGELVVIERIRSSRD